MLQATPVLFCCLQVPKEQFDKVMDTYNKGKLPSYRSLCHGACQHNSLQATPVFFFCLQVSKEQFDKILDMCKKGEEQGAKLETGGKRLGDKGYYIEPTVFSNVQDDNIIATDEIFGPVQSILKWSTLDEVSFAVTFCTLSPSSPLIVVSARVHGIKNSSAQTVVSSFVALSITHSGLL